MKKFHIARLCFAAVTACVLCGMSRSVVAQTTNSSQPYYLVIKLHNVRPDIMAYWIDPAHQTVPQEYNYLTYSKLSQEQINQYVPQIKVFEHSFHGQIITVTDAQNSLMISADQDDLDHDKALIESMDKPIEQVEVNTVIASGNPQVLKTIPTQPFKSQNAKPQNASYNIGLMTKDADSLVEQLISSGKLKQMNSLRLTVMDGFPAVIGSVTTSPIPLEMKQEPGYDFPSEAIEAIEQKKIGLQVQSNVRAIATANADGTVTLSVTISDDEYLVDFQELESYDKQSLPNTKTPDSIFLKSLYGGPVTLNYTVKDNQSVLVTGLDRILSNGYDTGNDRILIITPRILRRNKVLLVR